MSLAEHFTRNHKTRTDRAIGRAYAQLAADPTACAAFAELLHGIRSRAPSILTAPCQGTDHAGIAVLVNLSRWSHAYLRSPADWSGTQGAGTHAPWRVAIDSLVRHLVAKYPVPRFLTSAWHTPGDADGEQQRGWYVMHAGGCSFRSMDLPISMNRRMESLFLRSPDHLEIHAAMRRAELKGLQIRKDIATAVLSTCVATDLRHGDFWRTVWHFLRVHADELDIGQVAPLIDFIYSIRQEKITAVTAEGTTYSEPPSLPDFSIKGRTPASLLRLMHEWHRGLAFGRGGLSWSRSALRSMTIDVPPVDPSEPPVRWQFVELINSEQLRFEGRALNHCVASYANRCWRGVCRIWSLRSIRGEKVRPVVTLEIDLANRTIVQARGFGNSYPFGQRMRLIRLWAAREGLRLAI
jgi:hypothetical protein